MDAAQTQTTGSSGMLLNMCSEYVPIDLAGLGSRMVLIMPEPWDCLIAKRKISEALTKRIG